MSRRWWCSSSNVMKQSLAVFFRHACSPPAAPSRPFRSCRYHYTFSVSAALSNAISESLSEKQNVHSFCSSSSGEPSGVKQGIEVGEDSMSFVEAKKLLRLVNVEALKMKLEMEGEEIIRYPELLDACKSMGLARSLDEAVEFARVLDKAGVVLLFRDKVYLHPNKVVDLVRKAVPIALTLENDPMQEELNGLQEKKKEIDSLAHKQVRHILWTGLAIAIAQVGLFFRLTFWEFSWDVMEPVAFFITTTGLVVGYAYFLITSRDPTYQDFMKRLFLSRQRKLFKLHYFNVERFKELQRKCKPL